MSPLTALPSTAKRLLFYFFTLLLLSIVYLSQRQLGGLDLSPRLSAAVSGVRQTISNGREKSGWSWAIPFGAEELSVESREELDYDHQAARSTWFSPWSRWAASSRSLLEYTASYASLPSIGLGFSRSEGRRIDWDGLSPEVREFKEWEFARAMIYEGTGARVQRFLEKARRGEGFVVSVVGGSVSKGRGLPDIPYANLTANPIPPHRPSSLSPSSTLKRSSGSTFPKDEDPAVSLNLYNPHNLHHQIYTYLDSAFPVSAQARERGKRNIFVNGAQGGTSSEYFAGCWKEHVPEDSDLVLVELGINDLRDFASMEAYELLVRSLLEMPSQPAIINIQTFTLLFPTLSQASSLHLDVAAYYDTPVVSIRDVLLPRILNQEAASSSKRDLLTGPFAPGGRTDKRMTSAEAQLSRIKRGLPIHTAKRAGYSTNLGERNSRDAAQEIRKWFRNVEGSTAGDAKVVGNVDLMHISQSAHALVSELIIHYLQLQIARMDPKYDYYLEEGYGEEDEVDGGLMMGSGVTDVPGMLLAGHYIPNKHIRRSDPFCRSTNSAFEGRRLEPGPGSEGWRKWAWGEKNYVVSSTPGSPFNLEFHTWIPAVRRDTQLEHQVIATEESLAEEFADDQEDMGPLETLDHDGQGPRHTIGSAGLDKRGSRRVGEGYVKIGYQRSATYGLGSVECWVDDQEERKVRVDGWWDTKERNMVMITPIRDDLLPGKHVLHCTLLEETLDPGGGREFRLIAVLYD